MVKMLNSTCWRLSNEESLYERFTMLGCMDEIRSQAY